MESFESRDEENFHFVRNVSTLLYYVSDFLDKTGN